MPHQIKHSTNW